jgi:hypothetical protein
MEFGEALSIVLALAQASRAMAETNEIVTEEVLDEAIKMVEVKVEVLSTMTGFPKPKR